jgi:hypothetical protein
MRQLLMHAQNKPTPNSVSQNAGRLRGRLGDTASDTTNAARRSNTGPLADRAMHQ